MVDLPSEPTWEQVVDPGASLLTSLLDTIAVLAISAGVAAGLAFHASWGWWGVPVGGALLLGLSQVAEAMRMPRTVKPDLKGQ